MMRWPWTRKTEDRESGGNYSDAVLRLIAAEAAGTAADVASTAAVECAAGSLARAFAAATVKGPPHVLEAVTPAVLSQIGRDLIRSGESLHVIDLDRSARFSLLPASAWTFEGNASPSTWSVRATTYGPSTSTTRRLPFAGVVFVRWGSTPARTHEGTAPTSWAHTTARLQSEAEKSLADESQGPLAQLLTVPKDGGDSSLDDLRADIGRARGKGVFVETTQGGYGQGPSGAPQRDWVPQRLGPNPPQSLVQLRRDVFDAVLASCGTPPSMFVANSDGTAQREAQRRYYLNTVLPLAGILERELRDKLAAPSLELVFDRYPLDLAGRAQAFQKLVAGGVPVTEALATSGLLADGET